MTLITGEEQIGQLQISHQKLCETSERSGTPFLKYQKERTVNPHSIATENTVQE